MTRADLLAAWTAIKTCRLRNLGGNLAIEVITRNIELGRPHLAHGAIKATAGVFGHPGRVRDMSLVFGEFLEHR